MSTAAYKWSQSNNSVTVSCAVHHAAKKADIDVVVSSPTTLKIIGKGGSTVLEGTLHGAVVPGSVKWSVRGAAVVVQVAKEPTKGPAAAPWTNLWCRQVVAAYDYESQEKIELSFLEGDVVTVLKEDDSGWWKGELNGKVGLFPYNFVEDIPMQSPEQDPIPFPDDDPSAAASPLGDSTEHQQPPEEDFPPAVPPQPRGIAMPGLGEGMTELRNRLVTRSEGGAAKGSIDELMRKRKEEQQKPAQDTGAAAMPKLRPAPPRARGTPGGSSPPPTAATAATGPIAPASAAPALPLKTAAVPAKGPAMPRKPAADPQAHPAVPGPEALRKVPPSTQAPSTPAPSLSSSAGPPAHVPKKIVQPPIAKGKMRSDSTAEGERGDPKEEFKKKLEAQQKLSLSGGVPGAGPAPIPTVSDTSSKGESTPQAAPKPTKEKNQSTCKALYDYDAAAEGELTFKEDNLILIRMKDDSGWWQGELDGEIGWFPANFVEEQTVEESVEAKLSEITSSPIQKLVTMKRASGIPGRRVPTMKRKPRSDSTVEMEEPVKSKPTTAQPELETPRGGRPPVRPKPAPASGRPAPARTIVEDTPEGQMSKPSTDDPKGPNSTQVKKAKPQDAPVTKDSSFLQSAKKDVRKMLVKGPGNAKSWPSNLPNFEDFCSQAVIIFEEVKQSCKSGSNSSHFPYLVSVNSDLFGFSICSVDGVQFCHGDNPHFSLQGCVLPFVYAMTAKEVGMEKLHNVIAVEPSAAPPFAFVLNSEKKPHNPFTTAGALCLTNMLYPGSDSVTQIANALEQLSASAEDRLPCSMPVYLSMTGGADKDIALAYWLRSMGILSKNTDTQKLLELYFQLCSVETTCKSAAVMATTLANGGVSPISSKKCFDAKASTRCLALLQTCGMNEASQLWAESVQLSAKCGLSGAIMLMIPNVGGLCVYSPSVDGKNISTRGFEFCRQLVSKFPALKTQK